MKTKTWWDWFILILTIMAVAMVVVLLVTGAGMLVTAAIAYNSFWGYALGIFLFAVGLTTLFWGLER